MDDVMKRFFERPMPKATPVSKEFWEGINRHEFLIQKCIACGQNIFYPRTHCTKCMSTDLKWIKSSGRGKIYSFTIVRQALLPAFFSEVPYVLAVIELEEGPHLLTNIVSTDIDKVKIGANVVVVYDEIAPQVILPKFKLV